MALHKMRAISSDLDENIKNLELELSNASHFLYEYNENNVHTEGVDKLQELLKYWNKINGELEEVIKQEDADITELTEHIDANEKYVNALEEKDIEFENYLVEQNLLEVETDNQEEDNEQSLNESNKQNSERRILNSPLPQFTPLNNTFLKCRQDLSTPENNTDFQNTMYEFQSASLTRNICFAKK